MKKTLSVLLALCMVLTAFSQSVFAAGKKMPKADVQMVMGEDFADSEIAAFADFAANYADDCGIDLESTVGAVLTVSEAGTGYDDWYVDTLLTLSADVKAKFYGRYDALDNNWYGSDIMGDYASLFPATSTFVNKLDSATGLVTLAEGDYAVMKECGIQRTVKEVAEGVEQFYCILAIDPSSIADTVKVNLDVAIVDSLPAEIDDYTCVPLTTTSVPIEASFTKALPTVDVQMVKGADFATSDIQAFADFADTFEDVNLKYTVGAVLKIEDKGFGYNNYFVDTILSVSEATDAKFYGLYDAYANYWCGLDDLAAYPENIPANSAIMNHYNSATKIVNLVAGDYSVMRECGVIRTLKEVADADGTFYCVLNVDPETFDNLDVKLSVKLYKDKVAPNYIDVAKTQASEAVEASFSKVAPTADIKMIDGANFATSGIPAFASFVTEHPELDMRYTVGAVLAIDDLGYGYNNYYVDAILNVTEDVSAKFYGCYPQFGDGAWIGAEALNEFSQYIPANSQIVNKYNSATGAIDLTAGQYSVARDCGAIFTLEAADENVDTFYCILSVDPNTFDTVKASLDLKLYEDPSDPVYVNMEKTADSVEVEKTFGKILPTASVKMVNGTDFATSGIEAFENFATDVDGIVADDLPYTVGAAFTMTDIGGGYDDYDFEALLDITADDSFKANLYGYFEDYGAWVGTDAITFEAGQYKVLESASYDCTVKRANEEIKTFYCVFVCDRASFNGTVGVALDVKISEDNVNYIDITKAQGSDTVAATFTKFDPAATSTVYTDEEFATTFAGQDILSAVDTCGYDFTNARIAKFVVTNNSNTGYDNSAVQVGINATDGNIHGAVLYYNGETWEFVTEDMFYENEPVVATIDGLLLKDAETVYVAFVHDTITMVDKTDFAFELKVNDGKQALSLTDVATSIQKLRAYDLAGNTETATTTNLILNDKAGEIKTHYLASDGVVAEDTVVYFTDKNNHKLGDADKIVTGDKMVVVDTQTFEKKETTIVIKGDSNCDGDFTVEDYSDIVNNAVGEPSMEDYTVQACDLNNDGVVDVLDAVSADRFVNNKCVYEDVIKRAF